MLRNIRIESPYKEQNGEIPILPGNSLEPTVIPTAQASSFTLQYFTYYV
jgi:hypothetical protein